MVVNAKKEVFVNKLFFIQLLEKVICILKICKEEADLKQMICSKCSNDCANCTVTDTGMIFHSCSDGFYKDSNGKCAECKIPCATCENSSTFCKTSEFQSDNAICTTCIDGYYKNGELCSQCNQECATCHQSGSDFCFTCSKGYFKLKEYTYPVPYRGQCTACNDPEKGDPHCSDDNLGAGSECKFTCTKKCIQCPDNCKE